MGVTQMCGRQVFLVSSPLQALVVFLIHSDGRFSNPIKKPLIFLEGELHFPPCDTAEVIPISNTRWNRSSIPKVATKLLEYLMEDEIDLWVSELLWPMNNHFYSLLKENKKLKSLNFFDEGLVLYYNHKHNKALYLREVLKSIVFKFIYGKYQIPNRDPFYGYQELRNVVAINPDAMDPNKFKSQLLIKEKRLAEFFRTYPSAQKLEKSISAVKGSSVLLSQPMYRVIGDDLFLDILTDLISYLSDNGYTDVMVKLHPSEGLEEFEKYYQPLGLKTLPIGSELPFEIFVRNLSKDSALISFSSSVLLNARQFGFRGKLVAFGLDRVLDFRKLLYIGALSKFQQIFSAADVEVVTKWNN